MIVAKCANIHSNDDRYSPNLSQQKTFQKFLGQLMQVPPSPGGSEQHWHYGADEACVRKKRLLNSGIVSARRNAESFRLYSAKA